MGPTASLDTIEIKLTKGYTACIDAIDADLIQFSWHYNNRGTSICAQRRDYSVGASRGKLVRLHREIYERVLGRKLSSGELIDHIDGNPLNNCRSNLRIATKEQNAWNSKTPKTNTSGYKGVHFDKKLSKWIAQIRIDKQIKYLGVFPTAEQAYEAYCSAAKAYRGEFAKLS